MKALILAAGYATRLYPLTRNKAKPLLPVKGSPIVNYIVKKIETIDEVDRIYLVTNNKFYNDFVEWSEIYKFKKKIEIINDQTLGDETKLGAIGDIKFVVDNKIIKEDFLIVAGDNLFSFNLHNFIEKVYGLEEAVCLGLHDVKEKEMAQLYGIVSINKENQIVDFQEKPSSPKSTLAAVGIYFIPKGKVNLISKYLEEGNTSDQPGYFINWLCKRDKVYGFLLPGDWFDIGNIESYERANGTWKEEEEID